MPKQIPLRNSEKLTIVDDEDFEYLKQFKWRINSYGYVIRTACTKMIKGKRKVWSVYIHREILKTPTGMDTDHIDRNPLNNQKSNIRIASRTENNLNRISSPGSRSKYKGVWWYEKSQKWGASIGYKGEKKFLGYFSTQEFAAMAYDQAAKNLPSHFIRLNFPVRNADQ